MACDVLQTKQVQTVRRIVMGAKHSAAGMFNVIDPFLPLVSGKRPTAPFG